MAWQSALLKMVSSLTFELDGEADRRAAQPARTSTHCGSAPVIRGSTCRYVQDGQVRRFVEALERARPSRPVVAAATQVGLGRPVAGWP